MFLYGLTILVSAFLLFQVQPLIAKRILPWFGGSAAVWTTCLVFFQAALLAGYAYSWLGSKRLRGTAQVVLHITLLAIAITFLPIEPGARWRPAASVIDHPAMQILLM